MKHFVSVSEEISLFVKHATFGCANNSNTDSCVTYPGMLLGITGYLQHRKSTQEMEAVHLGTIMIIKTSVHLVINYHRL